MITGARPQAESVGFDAMHTNLSSFLARDTGAEAFYIHGTNNPLRYTVGTCTRSHGVPVNDNGYASGDVASNLARIMQFRHLHYGEKVALTFFVQRRDIKRSALGYDILFTPS